MKQFNLLSQIFKAGLLCGILLVSGIAISWAQTAPTYNGGRNQTLSVCQNSSGNSINSLLAVTDIDLGNTLTWTATLAPSHGSLNILGSSISTGGSVTPTGKSYTPAPGYSGTDVFTIQVSDGTGGTALTTVSVTVNPLPAAIGGSHSVCHTGTTTLTNAISGGVWSSSRTAVATVGSATGLVSGVGAGTSVISYSLGCGTPSLFTVTVNASPGAISGATTVCQSGTTTLGNAALNGTWTSGATGVATVGATSGVVTGVSAGTTIITYSNGCGFPATLTINTIPLPGTTSGSTPTCEGNTMTLTNTISGGTWSSSDAGIATVGLFTGVVGGLSGGNATITYSTGCGTPALQTVTIVATPRSITGPIIICQGVSTLMGNSAAGGTWSSSAPGVATINTTSGLLTSVAGGTTTITYTTGCGTPATQVVTVTSFTGTISGPTSVCQTSTITLTNSTPGGSWSSSDESIGTVGSTSGIVTGIAGGTVIISYTNGCGAVATRTISVISSPGVLSGPATVCQGATGLMTSTAPGGVWLSSASTIATVGSISGIVTGVTGGTATISYATGCFTAATRTISVMPTPAAIGGASVVCQSATITLTNTVPGGVWSSGSTGIATVGSTGIVTGVSGGVANITYSNGCSPDAVKSVSVTPTPAAITGVTTVCQGATTTLANTSGGGIWTSGATGIATVGSLTGVVTGVAGGVANITYNNGCGSAASIAITVTPLPAAIGGASVLCQSASTTLTNTVPGGIWTSGNTAIATVGSSSGTVTGISGGIVTITYSNGCGAGVTRTMTITPIPAAITGSATVCQSGTTTLANTSAGGVWTSAATGIATIGSASGVVSGVAAGTATITYSTGCGAAATTVITVIPLPGIIIGNTSLCQGTTTALFNTVNGGTWSSSNTAIATIGSVSGVVTGIAGGLVSLTYSTGCGAPVTRLETVTAIPDTIRGTFGVCQGSTTTLTNIVGGGIWTSGATGVATVGSLTGVVTGITGGTAVITYNNGCLPAATQAVTVTPLTGVISGATTVCQSATVTLTNTGAGGTWTSSATGVATIDAVTGVVTGVGAGTTTITYTTGCGAPATRIQSVTPTPGTISGSSALCQGATTTFTNSASGGIWTSSNSVVATVGSTTGLVTGVNGVTATITYNTGCGTAATLTLTVTPVPGVIVGAFSLCQGGTTTLTNSVIGGVWSSSVPGTASIDLNTGVVNGISGGTVTITYSTGCGTDATRIETVLVAPSAISGASVICQGSTTTFTNTSVGGIWLSANTGIATVGSLSGVVTAVAAGATTITYTNGCGTAATQSISVTPVPAAITGATSICLSSSSTLSNSVPGGTWSSSAVGVAPVDPTGLVRAIAMGTATITYSTGCGTPATANVTVVNTPGIINGVSSLCQGATYTFTNPISGGVWSSSNTGVATIGSASGLVTGVTAGTAYITYTTSCGYTVSSIVLTIVPNVAAITGATIVCQGSTTTLANTALGGSWSSGNTFVATVDNSTGVVTGVSAGTTIITYSTGCGTPATRAMSVTPIPGSISGGSVVCQASSFTLTNTASGGTWSSSNTAVATVGSLTGIVNGIIGGTTTITYSTGCGTAPIQTVSVTPFPGIISGSAVICEASTTTYFNTVAGGTWSSSSPAVATIGSLNGLITGVSGGLTNITYSTGCGTAAVRSLSVTPATGSTSGASVVCQGATTTLTNTATGGLWSSSNTGVATIGSLTGVVTGVSAGITSITYGTGCGAGSVVTISVTATPAAITGASSFCISSTTLLADATPNGTWSSSNTAIATVGTTGLVSGMGSGTAVITYSTGCGVPATRTMTVLPAPGIISGVTTLCQGNTATFTNPIAGGTWSSSNTGVATIGSASGLVTGVSAGTAAITYTTVCGYTVYSVLLTIIPNPAAITGASTICQGSTVTLGNTAVGGSWISSNTAVATIDNATGLLTGVSAGITNITYSTGCGAAATRTESVTPIPGAISGGNVVCQSSTFTLTNTASGGTWSSSNIGVATIGSLTGVVTGVAGGTTTMTYSTGCGTAPIQTVSVTPIPAAIVGTATICQGATTTLTNTAAGGTWSSSNTAVATIGALNGFMTGIAGGTAIITYSTGCGTAATRTVSVTPFAGTISGSTLVCQTGTSTLSNTAAGGTWSSSASTIASVGSLTGVVSGLAFGTATITYSTGCGTAATIAVTVTTTPGGITGANSVCQSNITTLTNTIIGGLWTSANTGVATIGSSTGVVAGVVAGTTTITYNTGCGAAATRTMSVVAAPSAISGASLVCQSGTITLTNTSVSGLWSSSNTAAATVGSTTGIVTGVAAGITTITYSTGCGTAATFDVSVTPIPAAITGASAVCQSATTTFTNTSLGGIWSSSNSGVASVGSLSGVVSGVSGGSATITYSTGCGVNATKAITVTPTPATISGASPICQAATATFTNAAAGGIWTSSNTAVATVGSTTGIVTGVAAGNTVISYATGCGTPATMTVSVTPLAAAITGAATICQTSTATLSNAALGGTWSSSNSAVAAIDLNTGVVMGIAGGTATITYNTGCGTAATRTESVTPLAGTTSGATVICQATSTTYTNTAAGGTWSSSNIAVATVGSLTGIVNGVAAGIATITYSTGCGTAATQDVSVTPTPAAITGTATICQGATTTLSNTALGGIWTSSNTGVATIGSLDGVVTGVAGGAVTITYNTGCGTAATRTQSITPLAGAITGSAIICQGATTTFTNTAPGGTWSSSTTGVATVGLLTGVVTGVAGGNTTITYSTGCGTAATQALSVTPIPAAITGGSAVCQAAILNLGNTALGGIWSSSNTGVATVGSLTGVVSGIVGGSATITYSTGCGTAATQNVTVTALPGTITGATSVCNLATTTYTNSIAGGRWSSSNITFATVGSVSGVVTGVSAGTAIISYSTGCGTPSSQTITIIPIPSPIITGITTICQGSTSTLANSAPGGVWSSSATGVATVGSNSGVITGVAGGSATITYSTGCGAAATTAVSVTPVPAAIAGSATVCVGLTTTLTNTVPFGIWSSGNTAVATVGSLTGIVTGVSSGVSVLSYSNTCGAASTFTITVNPLPASITGAASVCTGVTTTLASATSGGVWSSSNTGAATVGSATGVVTGVVAGAATITYTLPTGCIATSAITVNTTPAAITGASAVCAGSSITLSDATAGGAWSSDNTAVATIGAGTGIMNGIAAGSANITYTAANGCIAVANETVNPVPTITGSSSVCQATSTTLTPSVGPGLWTSSNTAAATVGSASGVVTGVAVGTSIMSYTVTGTGCTNAATITVAPIASAISGVTTVCPGGTSALTNALTGGYWTSSNPAIATVGSATGIVNAVSAGSVLISYTVPCGVVTTAFTVSAAPSAIGGTTTFCATASSLLSATPAGGAWSSSNTAVVTINPTTGLATGIAGGSATITYTLGSGCTTGSVITINAFGPIIGPAVVCLSSTITLSNIATGGTWTSGNTLVATVNPITGVVTGMRTGVTTITYSTSLGCRATTPMTVSASAPIAGPSSVCQGQNITLTNSGAGGTWSSSDISVATVGASSGVVTGVAAGSATISYAVSSGCVQTRVITVNPTAPIFGPTAVCQGQTVTLTNSMSGGSWGTGNALIASVGGSTGIVTGVNSGFTTISYTFAGTGCRVTFPITVNRLSPVTGLSSVCVSSVIVLTNANAGGTWTSDAPAIATVGASSGAVSGLSSGVANVSYTLSTGCTAVAAITVNPITPNAGGNSVCLSTPITLTNATPGGVWSSSNPTIASVGAGTGIVSGMRSGSTNITYTITGTGCKAVSAMVVNVCRMAGEDAITGQPDGNVSDIAIFPNPNQGEFTLRGTLNTTADEDVNVEVTNMMGQVVYSSVISAKGGRIDNSIHITNNLANGMYLLNLRAGQQKGVFHFVVSK